MIHIAYISSVYLFKLKSKVFFVFFLFGRGMNILVNECLLRFSFYIYIQIFHIIFWVLVLTWVQKSTSNSFSIHVPKQTLRWQNALLKKKKKKACLGRPPPLMIHIMYV